MAQLPPIPYDQPSTSFAWLDWYTKLQNLINSSGGVAHSGLTGLQGGTVGEYYHLTAPQYTAVANLSETIDDRVHALLVAGANVTLSYNDASNTLTISASGGAFPVGAIYINVTGVNPASELGYGTWSAFGTGRVLVGVDTSDTDFDTVLETGGSKTATIP